MEIELARGGGFIHYGSLIHGTHGCSEGKFLVERDCNYFGVVQGSIAIGCDNNGATSLTKHHLSPEKLAH